MQNTLSTIVTQAVEASAKKTKTESNTSLVSKNVRIHKRRTSVRLEPEMWNALNEIARTERCSVHDLCGAVYDLKDPASSFTASLRGFMVEYYRTASKLNNQVTQVQKKLFEIKDGQ